MAILLSSGQSVSADTITSKTECSSATLTRALRSLREAYNTTIKYNKSSHSYQITDVGNLTGIKIIQMQRAIDKLDNRSPNTSVSLAKTGKKSVSVSLSKAAISKLDNLANEQNVSRSDIIEMLIHS
ncbi:MAG: ribbon-helix-helix protein, CopG family [Enterovibrio sp.]